MAIELSVDFCGVKFKHPFLLASTTASRTERWKKAARAGWAGASSWALSAVGDARGVAWMALPNEFEYIDRSNENWFIQTGGHVGGIDLQKGPMPPELVAQCVRGCKASGLPVIVNIVGSFDVEPWVRASTAAEEAGADILELNFSSPYRSNLGLGIGRDKSKMQGIIGAVKARTRIPVMAKLSGHLLVGQLKDFSQSAVSAGADAISITNLIAGLAGVDIETGMPKWMYRDTEGKIRGCVTGISGPAIKPLALRSVAEVASAVRVPISAIGGITTWQSAVEFMMLGATTVQIGIAAITFGYGIVKDLTRGLSEFMQRKGYRRVTDFIGITNHRFAVGEEYTIPEMDQPRRILVDELLCDGCGRCAMVCDTNSYNAMRMVKGIARVKRERCVNCNMCQLICPRKAITSIWESGVLDR